MSVINEEFLMDQDLEKKTGIYSIQIRNFRKKLRKAETGEDAVTEKFFVNWSEFSIEIYVAGDDQGDGEHLSLYLNNHSDWMVRVRREVSVMGEILKSDISAGIVLKSKAARQGSSKGWLNCIPHDRCFNNDLLSHHGILTIEVKIELLAENIPGGGGDAHSQLTVIKAEGLLYKVAVQEEISGLKRKLDAQDIELRDLKSKVRQLKRNC